MITLISSTRAINENFEKMIRKNSGLKQDELEIIIFENNGEMSLTEVYNKGIEKSKNNILVFCHDDIEILSNDWGLKLLNHYKKSDYGILGVAGTRSMSSTGVWWANRESMYGIVSHTDGSNNWVNQYSRNFGNEIKEVVVVDGVFFSCDKSKIKKRFNEYYNNFHFYDISFCFENYKEDVKVGVVFDISIKHSSIGEVNDKWEENRIKFVEKESENLPMVSNIDIHYIDPKLNFNKEKKLAIIIPTKNSVDELLIPCINSLINNTRYNNYKIYIADTGSDKYELDKIKNFINLNEKIVLIEYDYYNFSKINNDVVNNKIDEDTEYLLFCNNDIEMLNDAISIMVKIYDENNKVGTVGCRLHYDNGGVQHLGISLEKNNSGELRFTHRFTNWDFDNINASANNLYTYGNTAAFMLVSLKLFKCLGCFNESYITCFEDVEFNLKCIINRKLNITTSKAVCIHYESRTRERKSHEKDVDRLLEFINDNPIISKTIKIIN